MQILLTGVSGRIGLHVYRALAEHGHQIRGLLGQRDVPELSATDTIRGDICDPATWQKAVADVEAVVHLAGISGEHKDAFRVNVLSTHLLVNACGNAGVDHIVFASSNCALGHCDRAAGDPFPFAVLPVEESHPLLPKTDYGLSKAIGEQVIRAACRRWDFQATAVRPAWVWSEQDCRRRARSELDEACYAGGLWAYVHVEDCARAFCLALEQKPRDFTAYYISAADTFADTRSADLAARFFPTARTASLQGHVSLFSWRAAERGIGYIPTRSWREYA